MASFPLIAVDIGNSRIKLGLFDSPAEADGLPNPSRTLEIESAEWDPVEIAIWLAPHKPVEFSWRIASVHRQATEQLIAWLTAEGASEIEQLTHDDLPLVIDLAEPEKVGIDRLLGAVSANYLRQENRAAVVIDLGSAITVDVVSSHGTFSGGAILPGIAMSARALDEFTDLLPNAGLSHLEDPPPALGTSTQEAMESGIYWGAIGAVRLLIEQIHREMKEATVPQVLLTGGAAESVAALLGDEVLYEPHLILAGIVLSMME